MQEVIIEISGPPGTDSAALAAIVRRALWSHHIECDVYGAAAKREVKIPVSELDSRINVVKETTRVKLLLPAVPTT